MDEINLDCVNSYSADIYLQEDEAPKTDKRNSEPAKKAETAEDDYVAVQLSASTQKTNSSLDLKQFFGYKNGSIEASQQNATGDCWLLSGVNALSYTEEGRKIIKSALEYCDGYTIVHLKGFGDVIVKDIEITGASLSLGYSSGDVDMKIFELAIEKVMDKIANGDEVVDPEAPYFMEHKDDLQSGIFEQSIDGGHINELIYLITGKAGKDGKGESNMRSQLAAFEKNGGKDIVLGAYTSSDQTAVDVNGKKVKLHGSHAYAVKEVKNGVVTFTDPHDSSKEIKLKIDDFIRCFEGTEMTDLSSKNPSVNYINRTFKVNKEGNRVYSFDRSNVDYDDVNGKPVKYAKEEVTYDKAGNIIERTVIDKNGKRAFSMIYDPKTGKKIEHRVYTKDNKMAISIDLDEYGCDKAYRISQCDDNGKPKSWTYFNSMEDVQKFYSRGFLENTKFTMYEIKSLLKLTDSEWEKAVKYMKNHPNAKANEIIKASKGK